jgi:hypothetical protein
MAIEADRNIDAVKNSLGTFWPEKVGEGVKRNQMVY